MKNIKKTKLISIFSIILFLTIQHNILVATENKKYDYLDGIDVSVWQGSIDWNQVYNAGYKFAFCKATEGVGWTDTYFFLNINNAKNAGVFIGPYHFATPELDDAVDEANYFISVIKNYTVNGYLRPVLDLEQGYELGQEALSNWVHTWMNTVENALDVQPIIYVNSNYANNYLDQSVNIYDLWIAHWTYDPNSSPNTGIWDNWNFWQYSNQGSVPGISGDVDLDVFNGNIIDLNEFIIQSNQTLDVNQDSFKRGLPIRHATDGDWAAGQNFTPLFTTLSHIKIFMRTLGWPDFDFVIELREEDPTGTLIATETFPKEEISNDWMWLEFDFPDITVETDTKYCIVVPSAPSGITNSFGYEWAYAFGDVYPDGSFWFNRLYPDDFWWQDLPNKYEFSFRTYGFN